MSFSVSAAFHSSSGKFANCHKVRNKLEWETFFFSFWNLCISIFFDFRKHKCAQFVIYVFLLQVFPWLQTPWCFTESHQLLLSVYKVEISRGSPGKLFFVLKKSQLGLLLKVKKRRQVHQTVSFRKKRTWEEILERKGLLQILSKPQNALYQNHKKSVFCVIITIFRTFRTFKGGLESPFRQSMILTSNIAPRMQMRMYLRYIVIVEPLHSDITPQKKLLPPKQPSWWKVLKAKKHL